MNRKPLVALTLLVLTMGALSQGTVANFNDAEGFSGRHGFTCTSCHNVPDMGPAGDDQIYPQPATLEVTGIPESWTPGESYEFTITVLGGPPALSAPAPQGGFEIEANRGTFSVPVGMEEFIHVYAETGGAVTYTAEGTMMRSWSVIWNPPTIDVRPAAATVWIAGMAANGNHVIAAGQADQGELGDSVDNTTFRIEPSVATWNAWEATRLLPPEVVTDDLEVNAFDSFRIAGRHVDFDATHLGYSLDGGPWERMETGESWAIPFGNGLTPGTHTLLVRSESMDRLSDTTLLTIHVLDVEEVDTPFPTLAFLGVILVAMFWRRRP